MALDGAQIRVTIIADASQLTDAMTQAASTVTTSTGQMASGFKYVTAASTETAGALRSVGTSAEGAAVGITSTERAATVATARIAGMEAGSGMLGGALGRVAATSSTLAPILSAAFPLFAVIAAVQIVEDFSGKIEALRDEADQTTTKWDDFSASIVKQSDSLQIENLKLADTVAKLEGHPEPNQLAIGLLEAKQKSDDLLVSLENATAKAEELLEKGGVSFWAQMVTGVEATGGATDALQGPMNDYLAALARVHLAQAENSSDLKAAQENAENMRKAILAAADEQLKVVQAQMHAATQPFELKSATPFGPPEESGGMTEAQAREKFGPLLTMLTDLKASFQEMGTISQQSGVNASLETQAAAAQRASEQQKVLAEEFKKSWEALKEFEKAKEKFEQGFAKTLNDELKELDDESVAVAKFGAQSYVDDAKSQLSSFEAMARDQISKVEGQISTAEARASRENRNISGSEFLSEPQKQAAQKDVLADQYATEAAAIQPLIAMLQEEQASLEGTALSDQEKTSATEKLQQQIDALTNKLTALKAKMDEVGDDNWPVQLGNKMHAAFTQMDGTVNSSLHEWVAGHKTFQQAMYGVWSGIAQNAVMNLVKITEKTVEQLLIRKIVTLTTEQTIVAGKAAAAAEGAAISKGSAFQEQFAYAKAAAAKAYNALAGIPVVGPELGAVAAAGAFALLMAFKEGGIVPYDTTAVLHRQEMVLPERISTFIQERVGGPHPAFAGAGAGGGEQHIHINALDSRSVQDFVHRNSARLVNQVKGMWRDGWRPR
jgi:hypothetical protein